jgi:hypothetical protein
MRHLPSICSGSYPDSAAPFFGSLGGFIPVLAKKRIGHDKYEADSGGNAFCHSPE